MRMKFGCVRGSGFAARCEAVRGSGFAARCEAVRGSGFAARCEAVRGHGFAARCEAVRGYGFAARCEAGLCPAGNLLFTNRAMPAVRTWPLKPWAKGRTGGIAPTSNGLRRQAEPCLTSGGEAGNLSQKQPSRNVQPKRLFANHEDGMQKVFSAERCGLAAFGSGCRLRRPM